MKKFIYKILCFAVLFFVLDKLLLFWEARLPDLEYDQRLEKLIKDEIKAEIIILGSSRGARNVLAKELEDHTGKSCYNLSYPGSDVTFHEFLFRQCVQEKKHKPKLVVLMLDDPGYFYAYESINFRYDKLYPLTSYPMVRKELVAKQKKTTFLVDWVVAYRVRESFPSGLSAKTATAQETLLSHGSMPLDFTKEAFQNNNSDPSFEHEYHLDAEQADKKEAFLSILKRAKEQDVQLLLVHAPNFYKATVAFRNRIQTLVGTKALIYTYDSTNAAYKNPAYFYDISHLKLNGAKVFTEELAKAINQLE